MNIRSWLTASAASLSLLAAAPAVTPAAAGHVTAIACKSATIGGASKCIARGQFCARAHASQYRRYGLSCTKRDVNGRYHLQ